MTSTDTSRLSESFAHRWPTAICATLGSWAYSFTWNTVSVALPHMKGSFSATNDQIAWVMISFIVGSAAMTASVGWLSSRFGRKQLFLFSVGGFTLSLIGCGTATTLEQEVIWRFVQGVTGAPLIALGQIITVNAFPPNRYTMATSFWALGFVTGNFFGPVAGGYLIELYGWPSIYYFNIPICTGVFIAAAILVPKGSETRERLDWFGFATLIIGVSVLQYMLARGERLDWFESNEIIVVCIISVTLLYLFLVHTATAKNTFFDRALFRDFNFTLGQLAIFIVGAAIYMPLLLLPLMLEQIGDYPSLEIGKLLFYRGIGSILGLLVLTQVRDKFDPRPLVVFGLLCNVVPAWEMAHWNTQILPFDVIWTNFLSGIGTSCIWAPLNRIVLSKLKGRHQNQGFAMFYLNFDIGYSVGTSWIIGLHERYTQTNRAFLSENVTLSNELLRFPEVLQKWPISELDGLAALEIEISKQAAVIAYNNCFMISGLLMLILIPVCYLFKK